MNTSLRLTKIKFYAGRTASATALDISPSTVVVLVGPNNSGKSLALRELENLCWGQNTVRKVVEEIDVEFPASEEEAVDWVQPFKANPPEGQTDAPDTWWI